MATQDKLGALPSRERGELDKLVAAAKKALGDKLISVIVHGSAARGGAPIIRLPPPRADSPPRAFPCRRR